MLTSNELEQRILSLLDEFRSDNVCAIINTVFVGERADEEIALYQEALRGLIAKKYVTVSFEKDGAPHKPVSEQDALELVSQISDELIPGAKKQRWEWKAFQQSRLPFEVVLLEVKVTDVGQIEAKSIVSGRGERWWKSKR